MKVYTKTGDKGQTSLIGGTRINKNDVRLEAYGTIDELNSFVGLLVSEVTEEEHKKFLLSIQNSLFDMGSCLALDTTKPETEKYGISFDKTEISKIESEIDRLSENLPPLKSFVIPGGTKAAALAHVCRTVSRRAERCIYTMSEHYQVESEILIYVNRLSDYFFVLSRCFNKERGTEIFYTKL
ncbi:cob(I)yrinic acid a,c-diamide adenosyltransferase [Paludibacter sp. 221]|uniref:cob(I)yrinic acid a,c-diamide adenosyltransferase n=1 Tax=Paludibacter sp. 221 TaxID=2302939 RepID=UPI0013D5702B|nr:cob(I)yrinic acid a,c-diamide adenosyltransferase [Paludibacter sp. 221]NDV46342.1 cob(I)yrinic acid a,c-diamide adenosyltransferase [Paludibacter sp. 221]